MDSHRSRAVRQRLGCLAAAGGLGAVALTALGAVAPPAWAADCGNAAIRQQQEASLLPDCRAYEMVSPADKEANGVRNLVNPPEFQPAPDGSAIAYNAPGSFAGNPDNSAINFYRASRGAYGWSNLPLNAFNESTHFLANAALGVLAVSPDVSEALVQSTAALAPGGVAGDANLYVRDIASDRYTLVATTGDPVAFQPFATPFVYVGASTDFSRIVFQASEPLLPGAAASSMPDVYEWSDGTLRLVSDTADGPGGQVNSGLAGTAVSADGGSVVFDSSTSGVRQVYLRTGTNPAIDVSATQKDPADAVRRDATFAAATSDHSEIYFTSSEDLTDDATTHASAHQSEELYRYDTASGALTDLTTDPLSSGNVQGIVGMTSDGGYVYFVASGVFAPGAIEGASNIYLLRAGQLSTVGQLGSVSIRGGTAMSANGQYLEFMSDAQLTSHPAGSVEVYVYDAAQGSGGTVSCASCGPAGGPLSGSVSIVPDVLSGGLSNYVPLVMTDNGEAFFQTTAALVSSDTNGARDVYAYDDGVLSPITHGESDSLLEGTTPSGNDVFFLSEDRLVAQDRDGLYDLYDARVGGGIPAQNVSVPAATPPCSDDTCQGPATPAPAALPTAGSITFNGAGNVTASAAPKPRRAVVSGHRTVRGAVATLTVRVPSAGQLSAAGKGLHSVRKHATRAATYRLRLALASSGKRTLAQRHMVRVRVRVAFAPKSGRASSTTLVLTFKSKGR